MFFFFFFLNNVYFLLHVIHVLPVVCKDIFDAIILTPIDLTLKPIFQCDAKPFAFGTFASPNAKDTNLLVSFALGDANFSRHPTQWNIGCVGFQTQNSCVGHVFFFFLNTVYFLRHVIHVLPVVCKDIFDAISFLPL